MWLWLDKLWSTKAGKKALRHCQLRERGLDVELVALGGPRDLGGLKGLAQTHGVEDALICEGEVQHQDLAAYYRGADVVLVASHREGFGLVGLEAMACGAGWYQPRLAA